MLTFMRISTHSGPCLTMDRALDDLVQTLQCRDGDAAAMQMQRFALFIRDSTPEDWLQGACSPARLSALAAELSGRSPEAAIPAAATLVSPPSRSLSAIEYQAHTTSVAQAFQTPAAAAAAAQVIAQPGAPCDSARVMGALAIIGLCVVVSGDEGRGWRCDGVGQ